MCGGIEIDCDFLRAEVLFVALKTDAKKRKKSKMTVISALLLRRVCDATSQNNMAPTSVAAA